MKMFVRSIYAGAMIGIGGMAYLMVDNKYIGAFLFSIGLLSVLIFGLDLLTGKVCYQDYLFTPWRLTLIGVGNLVGASIWSIISSPHENVRQAIQSVIQDKINKSMGVVFVDAVICGICIGLAVKGYNKAEGIGKYLSVILGVMVFILTGAEHCIADIYYFNVYALCSVDWYPHVFLFMLIVVIGNIIGGALTSIFGN